MKTDLKYDYYKKYEVFIKNKEEKYKKAINELADSYELHLKQWAKRCIDTINEYTTNLQQENKKQKEVIDKAINDIDLVIELIKQQPTEDDSWILSRLNAFKIILKEVSE